MSAPVCTCAYGQPAPGGGYFTIHAESCPMRDWVEPESDNGLVLALKLADDDLADLADYFAERHDVTNSGAPNEEMSLSEAVHRVRMLHQRIIEGRRPLPTHGYTALGAEGK